jgi:hypothetical protein
MNEAQSYITKAQNILASRPKTFITIAIVFFIFLFFMFFLRIETEKVTLPQTQQIRQVEV